MNSTIAKIIIIDKNIFKMILHSHSNMHQRKNLDRNKWQVP